MKYTSWMKPGNETRKEVALHVAGWMKNGLCGRWICCWLYITVIAQCLLIHKKEKCELSVTEWHGHVWLQKKLVWTTNKAVLGGLLLTFMHRFGWWDFVDFITKPKYSRRKMVFISQGQDVLWSQKVCWKCIFLGSGDPNVKISSFTSHHGGALGDTDLARQKCLDKSLVWLERTPGVN